jgi:hypothetical protein
VLGHVNSFAIEVRLFVKPHVAALVTAVILDTRAVRDQIEQRADVIA